jgi:hypothetical protein
MKASLKAVSFACALCAALACHSSSYGVGLCEYLGIGSKPCGCGNPNCCDGCEPNRWIGMGGGCGCEANCGCGTGCGDCCEASCGCGASNCGCGSYCVDGRSFAGKTYNCGCESYMPMRGCTGPACCDSGCGGCGCGDSCEAGCGCEASCGCGDCCEASCGCGSSCCKKKTSCCSGLFSACGRMCSALCGGGSCGCSGEMYWSEWHNDPPRCCDPCNRCGQWVGPPSGGGCGGCGSCGCGGCGSGGCDSCGPSGCGCYGGAPNGDYSSYATNRPTGAAHGNTTYAANRPGHPTTSTPVARKTPNPYTNPHAARLPQQGANQQYQR